MMGKGATMLGRGGRGHPLGPPGQLVPRGANVTMMSGGFQKVFSWEMFLRSFSIIQTRAYDIDGIKSGSGTKVSIQGMSRALQLCLGRVGDV